MLRKVGVLLLLAAGGTACARKPAAIDMSPRQAKIYGLQRTQRLTGRGVDRKNRPGAGADRTWVSSKPEIVTVDGGGKLESKSQGKSIITASFQNLSVTVPVEVLDIKSIEIAPLSAHLVGPAGTTVALTTTGKNSKGN